VRAGLNLARRRRFHKSRTLRELAAALRSSLRDVDTPDLAHLAYYGELAVGPVQRDEALVLHGLVRVVRPRTAVEIGFLRGDSAYNFLRALDPDARLYSFDVDPNCEAVAERISGDDPRLVYRTRAQETLTAEDVDGRVVDFVFVDGAHDLTLNQQTFERLLPMLAPDAIVAVHDTGTVPGKYIPDWREERKRPERWRGDEYEPQPDERAFVNWIREAYPEFAQLHLHTHRYPRHGLTVLQRSASLPRPQSG
jgi:predicted O-methyltransferase YrrM